MNKLDKLKKIITEEINNLYNIDDIHIGTVGDLKKIIAHLPDNMPVVNSHSESTTISVFNNNELHISVT